MVGHYKRSKFLAEQAVRKRAAELGFPVVTVNPSTPIGPRDIKPTPTGRILLDAAAGRMPAFVDTGLNLVHVDDVAQGHLAALKRGTPGERYILGGDDFTLQQILALVAEHVGRRASTIRLPHWSVYPRRRRGRGGREAHETRAARDARRRADVDEAHVFLESQGAARARSIDGAIRGSAIAAAVDWFKAMATSKHNGRAQRARAPARTSRSSSIGARPTRA